MARLASHIWVSAYLMRLTTEGVFAHVAHRGEATAGAVAVKLATMDGRASLFTRYYTVEGQLAWACDVEAGPEGEVDARVARLRRADRDLWVIEVEDPAGRHGLTEDGPGGRWPGI